MRINEHNFVVVTSETKPRAKPQLGMDPVASATMSDPEPKLWL